MADPVERDRRIKESAADLYAELRCCVGLLVEVGNLNGFRNLSEQELGRMWRVTATKAGMLLNKIDGLPNDYKSTTGGR